MRLGGKERRKYLLHHLLRHPQTVVTYRDHKLFTLFFCADGYLRRKITAQLFLFLIYGIAGIVHYINDHAAKVMPIYGYAAQRSVISRFQRDVKFTVLRPYALVSQLHGFIH